MRIGTWTSVQILRCLPRKALSQSIGWLCDRRLPACISRAAQRVFVRLHAVDMSDVAHQRGAYPTFDACFTRPLRSEARAISAAPIVCPADGRLVALGRIEGGARFRVKAQDYSVRDLIGEDTEDYVGGSYAVLYLAPGDYHRVHAPVDGRVRTVRRISGDLYPVNTLGERHVPRLLVRNERVIVFVDTPEFGRVAVVLVGAFIVGRVTVSMLQSASIAPGDHSIDPPAHVARGDEIGTFHLGSTVVLLVGRNVLLSGVIGPVRYGQPLLG